MLKEPCTEFEAVPIQADGCPPEVCLCLGFLPVKIENIVSSGACRLPAHAQDGGIEVK